MRKVLEFLFLSVAVVTASSCNIDEVVTAPPAPEIILEDGGIYSVKVGAEVRLAPEYKNVEDATFEWSIAGEVVCTERAYIYTAESIGEVYVSLTVATDAGSDTAEMRIDILALETPIVDIAMQDITVTVGYSKTLTAVVRDTELETTIFWSLNGEKVAEGESYLFEATATGIYVITATAKNADGEASDRVTITVVEPSEMPFAYEFATTEYHTVVGRNLRIAPTRIGDSEGVAYMWMLNDTATECCTPYYVFNVDNEGEYTLTATATAGDSILITTLTITVYAEGEFRRERTASSSSDFSAIVEYMPAPGQFIGDLKTGGFTGEELTMAAATAYAEERLREGNWVSLGAFGGYIVAAFDHSIENRDGADLAITGNAFDGSSEPGIVWVMQDENGNGLADDTWYELRGSEWGKEETILDYAVTYYRPSGTGMAVAWEDNIGNIGTVDYLKSFHTQDYYYPTWVAEDSYTLRGTRLEARNYDKSGNGSLWVQPHYDWGYADNNSPTDCADAVNSLDIANAVDCMGESVDLNFVDFVKIQCAVQSKSGWVGEISTEVCGISEITE